MGAHSTLAISRKTAIRKLREIDWNSWSDEKIEDLLGALYYDSLYNFSIDNLNPDDDTILERL